MQSKGDKSSTRLKRDTEGETGVNEDEDEEEEEEELKLKSSSWSSFIYILPFPEQRSPRHANRDRTNQN